MDSMPPPSPGCIPGVKLGSLLRTVIYFPSLCSLLFCSPSHTCCALHTACTFCHLSQSSADGRRADTPRNPPQRQTEGKHATGHVSIQRLRVSKVPDNQTEGCFPSPELDGVSDTIILSLCNLKLII